MNWVEAFRLYKLGQNWYAKCKMEQYRVSMHGYQHKGSVQGSTCSEVYLKEQALAACKDEQG